LRLRSLQEHVELLHLSAPGFLLALEQHVFASKFFFQKLDFLFLLVHESLVRGCDVCSNLGDDGALVSHVLWRCYGCSMLRCMLHRI
jgi:hypothetical protein